MKMVMMFANYEARVRFGTRVRVWDSTIFEKVECGNLEFSN